MKPFTNNPRRLSKTQAERLDKTMDEFGDLSGIVHDLDTDEIIGGNQRVNVKKLMGLRPTITEEFKAARVDGTVAVGYFDIGGRRFNYRAVKGWSEDQRRRANLVANAGGGSWDLDELANLDPGLLRAVGFDEDMLRESQSLVAALKALGETPVLEGLTDSDAVPEPPKVAITKPGDLWVMGDHKLLCGDSTKREDVERLIDGAKIDMVFTDPPYGINAVKVNGKGFGSIGGAKPFGAVGGGGRPGAMYPFGGVKNLLGRVHGPAKNAIIKPNLYAPVIGDDSTETAIKAYQLCADLKISTMILWGGNYYANALPPSRCWIVWDKENTGNFADVELAWTNQDAPARLFRHMWSGLMKASERGERRVHPTQKPVALAEWTFNEFGKSGDKVLDLFGGSGSTLIACERVGRVGYLAEMSPDYCDVIVKRWEEFTGKKAMRA